MLTGFNEVSWGVCCSSYVSSAKHLSPFQFNKMIKILNDSDYDIHANIIDLSLSSEEDADCKETLLMHTSG